MPHFTFPKIKRSSTSLLLGKSGPGRRCSVSAPTMEGLIALLPPPVRACLMGRAALVLSRFTPDGRQSARALVAWKVKAIEVRERRERQRKAGLKMSPTGRAMGKALRAWNDFAVSRKRRILTLKNALARLTPEGRMRHVGMQAFKSRTPTWASGAALIVSPDGFWVTSTRNKERESAVATPQIFARRHEAGAGIFRFGFRINGSGAGMVIGVADATAPLKDQHSAVDVRGWGLHLSHGALYTKRPGSSKGAPACCALPMLAPCCGPALPCGQRVHACFSPRRVCE